MPTPDFDQNHLLHKIVLRVIRAGLTFAFRLLYYPFAFAYDAVAWVVSIGEWADWRRCVLPLLPAGQVLELAHGTGTLALDLADAGFQVFALDLSPAMTRIAARKRAAWRKRHPGRQGPHLLRADAVRLPFSGDLFSGAVSTFPAEFILDPQTLMDIQRCLAPGGRLIIIPSAAPEWLASRSPLYSGKEEAEKYLRRLQPQMPPGLAFRVEIIRRPRSRVIAFIVEKRPPSEPSVGRDNKP